MKLLTATIQTQGDSPLDFHYCNEDELLVFGLECDRGACDYGCGCQRSLFGITTGKSSTTFRVTESPLSFRALRDLVELSLLDSGWYSEASQETASHAKALLLQVAEIADHFPTGTILERRAQEFLRRGAPT